MARRILQPLDELDRLHSRSVKSIRMSVRDVMLAQVEGDRRKKEQASLRLSRQLLASQGIADMLGRRRVFLELDAMRGGKVDVQAEGAVNFQAETETAVSPLVPDVQFREALADITNREPRLAETADLVAEVYSSDEKAFALARSSDLVITDNVRQVIASAVRDGFTRAEAIDQIRNEDTESFSRAYSETVFRTNLSTAYTAGRFQQASDPDIAEIAPAFRYDATNDADVRRGRQEDGGENHLALDGLIADTRDPLWRIFSPPNGFNCRCTILLIDRFELEGMGLVRDDGSIQPNKTVDPNWVHVNFRKGRPDLNIYLGAGNF